MTAQAQLAKGRAADLGREGKPLCKSPTDDLYEQLFGAKEYRLNNG